MSLSSYEVLIFSNNCAASHATHHLYAIYTLGAPPEVLDAAYETHVEYLRQAFDSPDEITELNWKEHFGNEK